MTKPCPACRRPLAGGLHNVCLSEDRRLRYWLEVEIPSGDEPAATCAFLMLNPSAADESSTDQTVRRCVGFAERGGYGRLVIVNLFASRSPNPQTPEPTPSARTTTRTSARRCGKPPSSRALGETGEPAPRRGLSRSARCFWRRAAGRNYARLAT